MDIHSILRSLGVGRQYLGYQMAARAVELAMADERCLYCVKQHIYIPLAEETACDWRSVERNIRTVTRRAWAVNPDLLIKMAGYPLQQAPTVTEFVEIISSYLLASGKEVG